MNNTTIQVTETVKTTLDRMKLFKRESYNEVIERMIEDNLELNEKTKKELSEARKRIKSGDFLTHEEVERMFNV